MGTLEIKKIHSEKSEKFYLLTGTLDFFLVSSCSLLSLSLAFSRPFFKFDNATAICDAT